MGKQPRVSESKGRAATNGRATLGRTTLLREVYRSLINTGRTYAAFREADRETVGQLVDRGPILDPMSGYGGLTSFCSELGIASVGVEYNPPQYFWQLLSHPGRTELHLAAIAALLRHRRKWPRPRKRAVVADEFFPDNTHSMLSRLVRLATELCSQLPSLGATDPSEAAVSLILPFVGRLACTSPGNVSTHTKQGGTCVLFGWQDDFRAYLDALHARTTMIRSRAKCTNHEIILGDARLVSFGRRRFKSMFTSPPYPNHRDFTSILLPENMFLQRFSEVHGLQLPCHKEEIVGSNFVKGEVICEPTSRIANNFIDEALSLRRNKRAEYDDRVYYVPYFKNYFSALEDAYRNVSRYLAVSFEGYAVVVNNTHRGLVVPVSEVVQDIWRTLGFQAEVFASKESFHVGTKNPRAKGIRARHTEYVVKIWR